MTERKLQDRVGSFMFATSRIFTLFSISFLVLSGSISLSADTVYEYQGNPFTSVTAPYSTSDSVSGFFSTAAPLPPNTFTVVVATTGFSFSDGVQTLTNATPGLNPGFSVRTDSTGAITSWGVFIQYTVSGFGILSSGATKNNSLDAGIINDSSQGSNGGSPGVWTRSNSVVPEPSSVGFFAAGGLALASLKRSIRAHKAKCERKFWAVSI